MSLFAQTPPATGGDSLSTKQRTYGNAVIGSENIQIPSQDERNRAVKEANECLKAIEAEDFQLDGFNLLSVVANPRSGMVGSSSSHARAAVSSQDNFSQQHQHRHHYQQQQETQLTPIKTTETSITKSRQSTPQLSSTDSAPSQQQQQEFHNESGIFSDAVQTFEDTLAQVTGQIETLNIFLGELSRHYLGDDTEESLFLEYYYQDEENTTSPAVRDVPPELADLQLQDLQSYLERCGVLAHTLVAQGLDTRTLVEEDVIDEEILEKQLQEIPSIFYETEFDLTDAKTFAELLLRRNDEDEANSAKNNHKINAPANSLYQPTHELVPVREQDFLAGHLDQVELALQEQVRQKSAAFFQETTRFSQLQSSIEDLLEQVQQLRTCLQQALSVYGQTKDISDHQRQDYEQLIDLLDRSMELVRCKASIGGLLSANDHLGAAQQVQYGRKLLQGNDDFLYSGKFRRDSVLMKNTENHRGADDGNHANDCLELQLLTSLTTCGDQLTQYESLVVQNLSDELVEIFFNWRPSEKDRIEEMLEALRICDAMNKTSELYSRRLQQMVRMTVRTTIAEFVESNKSGGSGGVTGMTYPAFFNCLEMLIEEIESILKTAQRVDDFCSKECILEGLSADNDQQQQQQHQSRWTREVVVQGSDLATKSIAELLRLRKEPHSLITLSEMKQLWDTCSQFSTTMESYSDNARAVNLRSTLVGQAKAFMDRTHESNMSALVAALDSERWSQCEVSLERQSALTRLCTGLATVSTPLRNLHESGTDDTIKEKKSVAVVEGVHYKVVWSCLLLVEMIMTNLSSAAHFQQSFATSAVAKVAELMRLFNARTTNLVLGAGAIHSGAKLKSINAKHLSYVTQCLGMMMSLLPHIRAALMAQLPARQHTLLADLDKIKKEYEDHNEKVLNKFVSIIGGIVEHGLGPRIPSIDFDSRAKNLGIKDGDVVECCVFLDGISSSTRKLHHVLNSLLPPDHLQDVFSRIFAHLDQKIPSLFDAAASTTTTNGNQIFSFPSTDEGKQRLILEVIHTTKNLNSLTGVLPWEFTAVHVLERKIDFKFQSDIIKIQDEDNNTGKSIRGKCTSAVEEEATDDITIENEGSLNGKHNKPINADENNKLSVMLQSSKAKDCQNGVLASHIKTPDEIIGQDIPNSTANDVSRLKENGTQKEN